MSDDMTPALVRLEAKLQSQLDQVKKTKSAINALHEAFDKPIPYSDIEQGEGIQTIRRGMFYGQPLATCVRTILEMRRAAQLDAASISEIYATLTEGGYAFETKDAENAKNGLRQSMRKNPVFHRIPSGEWGMLSWYPNAKVEKDDGDDDAQKKEKSAAPDAAAPVAQETVAPPAPPKVAKKKEKAASGDGTPQPVNEQTASVT